MHVSRRTLGLALAFAAIAALGGFTFLHMQTDGARSAGDPAGAERIATPGAEPQRATIAIPVEGAEVVRDTLVVAVTATGQAAALRQVLLSAQVPGRVAELPVRESDRLGAGALVVGIDAAQFRLALDGARATLRQRQAAFDEQTLFDDRIADTVLRAERQRVARAKSGVETAELDVRRAEVDLRQTRITAPFAGQVANVKVVPGQWVTTGTELATLVDLDPIKVEVQVLESEVGMLAPGGRAAVAFAAFPGETFDGRIQTINPLVEQATRTARVTVLVPNPARRILPGMYARVSLDARRFPDRVLVPRSAVLERDVDRRTLVFVYEPGGAGGAGGAGGGAAKWRYVTTGLGNATHVEVVADPDVQGLRPGETVLVNGHQTLTDGARVRLVENVAADAGRRP